MRPIKIDPAYALVRELRKRGIKAVVSKNGVVILSKSEANKIKEAIEAIKKLKLKPPKVITQ